MATAAPYHLPPRRITLEEWASLPEDEPGELVDGEIVEDEVSDRDHEDVVSWLMRALWAWIGPRAGRVYASDGKYAIRPGRGRKADLSVFLPGTPLPPRHGIWQTPPDIIVEVISSEARDERRDRVDKVADYAALGARSYWLVDPDQRTFEILALEGAHYERVICAERGTIDVPGCAGLRLDLDDLWAYISA
jgi:Uma2 family endonuclease